MYVLFEAVPTGTICCLLVPADVPIFFHRAVIVFLHEVYGRKVKHLPRRGKEGGGTYPPLLYP